MECTADRGAAQVLSDTAATSPQSPYPTTINPTSLQPSSFHSVMSHHVNFHLMAPATFFTVISLPWLVVFFFLLSPGHLDWHLSRPFRSWDMGEFCSCSSENWNPADTNRLIHLSEPRLYSVSFVLPRLAAQAGQQASARLWLVICSTQNGVKTHLEMSRSVKWCGLPSAYRLQLPEL